MKRISIPGWRESAVLLLWLGPFEHEKQSSAMIYIKGTTQDEYYIYIYIYRDIWKGHRSQYIARILYIKEIRGLNRIGRNTSKRPAPRRALDTPGQKLPPFQAISLWISLVSKVEESKTRGHFLENTAKGCWVYCRVTNTTLTDPLKTISHLLLLLHIGFFKNEQTSW